MHPIFGRFGVIIGEKMSVHIPALKVASVISNHHTIGICHGQNPKFEFVPHLVRQNVLA
jgi:hypothetical protein